MSSPLVSIIVPVYRVEKYLKECVESIIAQFFTDWELILVDDGSPDKSGVICDDYAAIDTRIHVFHQKNGGVSSARNLGLKKAQGKWVTFIDADDIVSATFIAGLLKPTFHDNEIDFVQGGCTNYVNGHAATVEQQYENVVSRDKAFVLNHFRGLAISKLFRIEIIKQYSDSLRVQFDEQMKIAEDMAFTLDYLIEIKKYAFVPEIGYYYRRDNAISATKRRKDDYLQELNGWRHIYNSYSNYVIKFKINQDHIVTRQRILADMLMATLLTICQYPCPINERIMRLKSDFNEKEIDLLFNASMTFFKIRIVSSLKKHYYRRAYFYMIAYRYKCYSQAILHKLIFFVHKLYK